MEQRQDAEIDVRSGGVSREELPAGHHVVVHVAVPELSSLRLARGAGGIEDDSCVVVVTIDSLESDCPTSKGGCVHLIRKEVIDGVTGADEEELAVDARLMESRPSL